MSGSANADSAAFQTTPPTGADKRPGPATGFSAWVREINPDICHIDVMVLGLSCAGCIRRVESLVRRHPAITHARLNFSTQRLSIDWQKAQGDIGEILDPVLEAGYDVRPLDYESLEAANGDSEGRALLRALAVAGFAASNIMLLSVAIWSGAEQATRDLFHWISALIALPTVVYSGRPFFRSAYGALKGGQLNMDVPISLAVLLAAAASLYETIQHGAHAYFDASVMLLFFLLIGRYLNHLMRAKARSAVAQLLTLSARGATIIRAGGSRTYLPIQDIEPGMIVAVAAGESIPVDGQIVSGVSDVDFSVVTGESAPQTIKSGNDVYAGARNLTGPLEIQVTAAGENSFLADIARMMEASEQSKARYVVLADRAARIYAPAVHIIAGLTFIGWLWASGDWRLALFTAVAVLIITCPCALGLAVPIAQVIASGRLFGNGIFVKDGAALERLATVDTIVFDKTGTLTLGEPILLPPNGKALAQLNLAASLAVKSNHPLSKALADAGDSQGFQRDPIDDIQEHPGRGLEGLWNGQQIRLGSRVFCGIADEKCPRTTGEGAMEICLRIGDDEPIFFECHDQIREDALETLTALADRGLEIHMLSGDRPAAVAGTAKTLNIRHYKARCTPQQKVAYLNKLSSQGRRVLMVGDGINDGPALAAAHVSMAPGSASDVGRLAADLVFLGPRLQPISLAIDISRKTQAIIKQNFVLALLYNAIAVPVAVAGLVTPLIAAIAMSSSSLLVVLNALRLHHGNFKFKRQAAKARQHALQFPDAPSLPVTGAGQ